MSPWGGRRTLIRLAIYLAALAVIWWLWRARSGLMPSYGLAVTEVREVDRLDSLWAGKGERLLVIDVRVDLPEDFSQPLDADLFRLLDDQGQEHTPDPRSPFFSIRWLSEQDGVRQGTLVFHVPMERAGRSLTFRP